MIWLPLLGLAAGVVIGAMTTFVIPIQYATYLSIALLATFDAGMGGLRGLLQRDFNLMLLITGFLGNTILALALTYLGIRLGLDLYLAAVFVFCYRIFRNFGAIRRILIIGRSKQKKKVSKHKEAE